MSSATPFTTTSLPATTTSSSTTTTTIATTTTTIATTTTTIATTTTTNPYARPDWLGTRLLPLRPDDEADVVEVRVHGVSLERCPASLCRNGGEL